MTSAEREAQLLEIAEQVLVERGYQGTTVEEIAERAGITKPVIYDHFSSKDELLARVVRNAHRDLESATVASYSQMKDQADAHELIRAVVQAWFTFIDSHRTALVLMRQERYLSLGRVEKIRVDQAQVIAAGLRTTRQFAHAEDRRMAIIGNAIVGITERSSIWRLDHEDVTPEQATDDVTQLIWQGIAPHANGD